MSNKKKPVTNQNYQQESKLGKVIHPQNFTKIRSTTKEKDIISTILDREFLVALLFLVGSFFFLVDGLIELAEGLSIRVFLHITASLMFVVGSYLFMPTDKTK